MILKQNKTKKNKNKPSVQLSKRCLMFERLPIGNTKKKGSQHMVKQPTTIANVLAAFCSLLNLATLLSSKPDELDKLFTLAQFLQ